MEVDRWFKLTHYFAFRVRASSGAVDWLRGVVAETIARRKTSGASVAAATPDHWEGAREAVSTWERHCDVSMSSSARNLMIGELVWRIAQMDKDCIPIDGEWEFLWVRRKDLAKMKPDYESN